MYCRNCGQLIPDGETVCSACGTVQFSSAAAPDPSYDQSYHQPYDQSGAQQPLQPAAGFSPAMDQGACAQPFQPFYQQEPAVQTKKEFLKLPENKKTHSEIRAAGIICYICAGVTLIVSLLGNPYGLLDTVILLVLGLLVHLLSSRAASIILTVYAAINMIISIASGSFGGWLILIAGIASIIYTFKAEKAWTTYKTAHGIMN